MLLKKTFILSMTLSKTSPTPWQERKFWLAQDLVLAESWSFIKAATQEPFFVDVMLKTVASLSLANLRGFTQVENLPSSQRALFTPVQ